MNNSLLHYIVWEVLTMKRVSCVRLLLLSARLSSQHFNSLGYIFMSSLIWPCYLLYNLHHMPSTSTAASTVNASKLNTHAKNHDLMNFLFYCLLCYNTMRLFRFIFFLHRKYIAIVNKDNIVWNENLEPTLVTLSSFIPHPPSQTTINKFTWKSCLCIECLERMYENRKAKSHSGRVTEIVKLEIKLN